MHCRHNINTFGLIIIIPSLDAHIPQGPAYRRLPHVFRACVQLALPKRQFPGDALEHDPASYRHVCGPLLGQFEARLIQWRSSTDERSECVDSLYGEGGESTFADGASPNETPEDIYNHAISAEQMLPGIVDPGLLALFVGFWLVMAVAWTPFLAARSVRRLFGDRPTTRLGVNYLLGMGAFTFVHVASVLAGLLVLTRDGGVNLMVVFEFAAGVTTVLVAVGWAAASFGLPRLGWWEPRGDGSDGRLVLAGGAVWYLLCTVVVTALLNFLVFFLVGFGH